MARQPRFILPGQLHLIRQRGHNGQAIALDAQDRQLWLDVLRDTAATHRILVQGWRIEHAEFRLLARPARAEALSRMLQDLGRRYVAAFNARHRRSGTLWDGRFRCAAVQAGANERVALRYVEQPSFGDAVLSSSPHHLGLRVDPWLDDPPAYWALGNTPFERQEAWRRELEQDLTAVELDAVERALRSGIPLADRQWLQQMQPLARVPLLPRPRGRPRRSPTEPADGSQR